MAKHSKRGEENELVLELSIGGIFGNLKKMNRNLSESVERGNRIEGFNVESKREIQSLPRRESKRKNEWLETQIFQQSQIESARKKGKIGIENILENTSSENQKLVSFNLNVKPIEGGGGRHAGVSNDSTGYASSCSSHREHSRSDSSNSQLDQQLATTSTASHPSDQPTGSSEHTISTHKLTDSSVNSEPRQAKQNDQLNPHELSLSNQPSKPVAVASRQHKRQTSFLASMPCVSTTGNGPNGKTVSGFLYICTKSEVSIVCVCHGLVFSPAGFVEHAGGVDVVHPLKHITIFQTAFAA